MNKHKLYAVIRLLFASLALTTVIVMSIVIGVVAAILTWVLCLTVNTQRGGVRV